MEEKALTADKALEEPVVEETEEEVVETQETVAEPEKKPEEAEPEEEKYLIDVGDIRFRDADAVVKSVENARQELIKRSRENRQKDAQIAQLSQTLADMERQLKALPTREQPANADDIEEILKEIAPSEEVDWAEYQRRVQSVLRKLPRAVTAKTEEKKPMPATETTVQTAPQLGPTERHILAECEALQVEHPELYDFDQTKLYDIMDDPFHPDRDKVTNLTEVMRLMGDGLTAERAHLIVEKRLERKAGAKKPATDGKNKAETKSPQEEVLGDLRRGRQAITTRPVQAAAESTKKVTTLQDALRSMNEEYRGM